MCDANLPCDRHTLVMAIYQIIPIGDGSGFNIGVAGSDGTRQTMLGFATQEEAEAWILQDKRLSGGESSLSNASAAIGS